MHRAYREERVLRGGCGYDAGGAVAVAGGGGARREARVVGKGLAPVFYIKIQTAASLLRIRQLTLFTTLLTTLLQRNRLVSSFHRPFVLQQRFTFRRPTVTVFARITPSRFPFSLRQLQGGLRESNTRRLRV